MCSMVCNEAILHGYAIITQTMAPTKQTETEKTQFLMIRHPVVSEEIWTASGKLKLWGNIWTTIYEKPKDTARQILNSTGIFHLQFCSAPETLHHGTRNTNFKKKQNQIKVLSTTKLWSSQSNQRIPLKKIWVQYSGKPRILTSREKNKLV